METTRLDALARSLTGTSSRRGLLYGASATALALAITRLPIDVEAKKKHKKHKKKKKRTRADATCPGPSDDALAIAAVNGRLAQTFTAIASGPLLRAELRITEPALTLGDYLLRLSSVDGAGVPTNIVLAETPALDVDVPNGQSTVSFAFASPFSIKAGTKYALVLTRPGSDQLVWAGHGSNSCTGTSFISDSQGGPFVAAGNIDLIFTTFVKS